MEKYYGIPVSTQISIEQKLDRLDELTELVFPELENYIHPDCIDYYNTYVLKTNKPMRVVLPNGKHKTRVIVMETERLQEK